MNTTSTSIPPHLSTAALLRALFAYPSHRRNASLARRRPPASSTLTATPTRRVSTLPSVLHPPPTFTSPQPSPKVTRRHLSSPRRAFDSARHSRFCKAAVAESLLRKHAPLQARIAARCLRCFTRSTPASMPRCRWPRRVALADQSCRTLWAPFRVIFVAKSAAKASALVNVVARCLAWLRLSLHSCKKRERRSALTLSLALDAWRRARAAFFIAVSACPARRRSRPRRNAWATARDSREARALDSTRWESAACWRSALPDAWRRCVNEKRVGRQARAY